MSLEHFTQGNELDENGDSPLDSLIKHNAAVREHWQVISALKSAIASEDWIDLAALWLAIPDSVKDVLWVAPTKGGIFTTKERELFKSNEAAEGRTMYIKEKA